MGLLSTSEVRARWQQLLSTKGRWWTGCQMCRMVQRLLRKILSDSKLYWQKKKKEKVQPGGGLRYGNLSDWIIWADTKTGTITSFSIDVLTRIVLCLSKMAIPTLAISIPHNHPNHCKMVKKKRYPSYEPKCTFFFFEKQRFKINSQYIHPNQMF